MCLRGRLPLIFRVPLHSAWGQSRNLKTTRSLRRSCGSLAEVPGLCPSSARACGRSSCLASWKLCAPRYLSRAASLNGDLSTSTQENPVLEAILARRTIGEFISEPVPEQIVLRALEAARWAPNHRLTEPWKFYWLGDSAIESASRIAANLIKAKGNPKRAESKYAKWRATPGWIVVTAKKSPEDPFIEQEDYAATCCSIHNLMLALHSQGVGSKWATGDVNQTKELAELLGYSLNQENPVGIVYFGYPAREGIRSVRRKTVEDILIRV